ncbi:hypothetical protein Ciccas_013769, partial [Cichlidogyrus casuarinus]
QTIEIEKILTDVLTVWLIRICLAVKNLAESHQFDTWLVASTEKEHGDDSVHLIVTLQRMATSIEELEQKSEETYQRALKYHHRAVEIGMKHKEITGCVFWLASATKKLEEFYSRKLDRSHETEQYYVNVLNELSSRKCADEIENCPNHGSDKHEMLMEKMTCSVRVALSKIYMFNRGRFEEALEMLRENLDREEQLFGEYSEQVATTLKIMASALIAHHSFKEALSLLKHCLQVEQTVFGLRSKQVANTRSMLSSLAQSVSGGGEIGEGGYRFIG